MLAGEPSGDMLGGRLMAALNRRAGDRLRFVGVGGARMAAQGLESLFPMDELSLIGMAEIIPHVPHLIRRLRETVDAVDRLGPAMVLTIDSPGFSLRLQRRLSGRPLHRVHYVAPQVWAWRAGRAKRLARDLDHLLALLPFEAPFFERYGLDCSFVGHPIVEEAGDRGDGGRFRSRHDLPEEGPLLCVLPGSRGNEVTRHLPVLRDAIGRLKERVPGLRVVAPTLPGIAPLVREIAATFTVPVIVLDDPGARFDAYAASTLAVAASGTVSLEVALAGLPCITIYRVGPLTGWLARRLILVPHVNMVNLILGRPAIPELLQEDFEAGRVATTMARLLEDETLRHRQRQDLAEAAARLGADDPRPPSERAAARVLEILNSEPERRTA